jgi:co-chaperonin GroES (HSP10)
VLPGSDRRIPSTGRVIKLGKGFQCASGVRIGFQVQEGDIVAYDPLSTLIVDFNHLGVDKKLELVSHANIIAVLVPYEGSLTQLVDEELCAQAERGKGYTFPIEPPSPSKLGKITVPVTDEEV